MRRCVCHNIIKDRASVMESPTGVSASGDPLPLFLFITYEICLRDTPPMTNYLEIGPPEIILKLTLLQIILKLALPEIILKLTLLEIILKLALLEIILELALFEIIMKLALLQTILKLALLK